MFAMLGMWFELNGEDSPMAKAGHWSEDGAQCPAASGEKTEPPVELTYPLVVR
jgi:hypothetical protein